MKYLSHYTEKAQSELFKSTGSFFAFGQNQFEKQRKEGVNYVSLGAGLICPKDTVNDLLLGLENIGVHGRQKDVEENGAAGIIEREYFNHECQLTTDTSTAEAALYGYTQQFPELFTPELIKSVFVKCFKKAVEYDMF